MSGGIATYTNPATCQQETIKGTKAQIEQELAKRGFTNFKYE